MRVDSSTQEKPVQAVRNVTLHVAPLHTYICSEISNMSVCFSGVPPHLSAVIRSDNLSATCSPFGLLDCSSGRDLRFMSKSVFAEEKKKKVNSLSYLVKTLQWSTHSLGFF